MERFQLVHPGENIADSLSFSRVGLGAWALGNKHWGPTSPEDALGTLEAAAELGINWVDTAPIYGEADHRVGSHAERLGLRIATKVGVRDRAPGHAYSDLHPGHIVEDCEASLRRLGVERIDLLQVHWPCERGTLLEDSLGSLGELRREGKIRSFGLCNYSEAGLRAALASSNAPASLQVPYSWLRRDQEPVIEFAGDSGVAVLAYETLGRGLLTGKYKTLPRFAQGDVRRSDPRFWGQRFFSIQGQLQGLRKAAVQRRVPPGALAIAWVLSNPKVSGVVLGARTPGQLREHCEALRRMEEVSGEL